MEVRKSFMKCQIASPIAYATQSRVLACESVPNGSLELNSTLSMASRPSSQTTHRVAWTLSLCDACTQVTDLDRSDLPHCS
jgi:hypothetical protein